MATQGESYGIFPRLDPTFLFYTERHAVVLESEEDILRFTSGPDRVFVLAERDDWAKLEKKPPLIELARDQDEKEGYLLLTNQNP